MEYNGISGKADEFHWPYRVLLVIVLSAGLTTIGNPFLNANIIAIHEMLFAALYLRRVRLLVILNSLRRSNKIVFYLFLAWIAGVTLSLVLSPLNVAAEHQGIARYVQTLSHIIFFVLVRDLLNRYPANHRDLLQMVPLAGCIVALVFAGLAIWHLINGTLLQQDWGSDPPLNSHIRHTGYQLAAGVAVVLGFMVSPVSKKSEFWINIVLLFVLSTFLAWTGGRGAIVSVLAAAVLLLILSGLKGGQWVRTALLILLLFASAAILSDMLKIYPWNGVTQSLTRTAEATDMGQLTTRRTEVWQVAWAAIKQHPILGLGPQGYFYLPSRPYGVQPHTVILQFLLEWGFVGSVLFSGLLVVGFFKGLRVHVVAAYGQLNPTAIASGAVILTLGLHGLTDGTFYHPQPSLYLALAFALWTSKPQIDHRRRE